MRRVYIAGPMRGPDLNHPAFFAAEERLRDAGWDVVNPARVDLDKGFDPTAPKLPREFYMRRDLPLVAECDALALLPYWRRSPGAIDELYVARSCALDVFDAETFEPIADDPRAVAQGILGDPTR